MKSFFLNVFVMVCFLTMGILVFQVHLAIAEEMGAVGEDYVYDETLSRAVDSGGEEEPSLSGTPPDKKPATFNLELDNPVTPYLGVEKKTETQPVTGPSSKTSGEGALMGRYHLETGIGLRLDKHSEFNLGYRMKDLQPLSKSQYEVDSLMSNGDIHFSFDIKLPF